MNTELLKIIVGAEGRYLTDQEIDRFRSYAVGVPDRVAAQRRLEAAEPHIVASAMDRFALKQGDYLKRVPLAREKGGRDMTFTLRYLGAAHVRDDQDFFLRSYATWISESLRAVTAVPVLVDAQRCLRDALDENLDPVDARAFCRYLDLFIAELERP